MTTLALILGLFILFYMLGKAADVIVVHIRRIGEKFRIPVFFLGILLGLLTTTPEFSIGINAGLDNIPEVSYGNLIGGIFVLFGLIIGVSAIYNRTIKTSGKIADILPIALYLVLPFVLSMKGGLGAIDGMLMIGLYVFLVYYFYSRAHVQRHLPLLSIHNNKNILPELFYVLIGLIGIILFSRGIIVLAEQLFGLFSVSPFVVGIILFSLGTNLPELIVAIRSWRNKVEGLSLSNLIGSAMANILVIGIFVYMRPLSVVIDTQYIALFLLACVLMTALVWAYHTNKRLSKREGIVFLTLYILFLVSQIALS